MEDTDLYSILFEYARKAQNAHINKESFLESLSISAKLKAHKSSAWKGWAYNTRETFQSEMDSLIAKELVNVSVEGRNEYINIPAYYIEYVRELWTQCTEKQMSPFPTITKAQTQIPKEITKTINFQTEFHSLLKNPLESDIPIIRLIMPDKAGAIFTINSILNSKFLEIALEKMRYYLVEKNFKQIFLERVISKLSNLSTLVENEFNVLILTPAECIIRIRLAEPNVFLIWTTLCSLIEESFAEKSDIQGIDLAALQSAHVIKSYSTYYREIVIDNDENIQFIKTFETNMDKEPYFFTIKNITHFTDDSGNVLVDKFSREAILNLLKQKTSITPDSNILPDVIVFLDSENEKWYTHKENLYKGFEHHRKIHRHQIHKDLNRRWHSLLKNFKMEPAMKDDKAFEELIKDITIYISPLILAVYNDEKFIITKEEFTPNSENAVSAAKYFNHTNGNLKHFTKLMNIERAYVLRSIRAQLPFWYSIPPLVSILRFFKNRL